MGVLITAITLILSVFVVVLPFKKQWLKQAVGTVPGGITAVLFGIILIVAELLLGYTFMGLLTMAYFIWLLLWGWGAFDKLRNPFQARTTAGTPNSRARTRRIAKSCWITLLAVGIITTVFLVVLVFAATRFAQPQQQPAGTPTQHLCTNSAGGSEFCTPTPSQPTQAPVQATPTQVTQTPTATPNTNCVWRTDGKGGWVLSCSTQTP